MNIDKFNEIKAKHPEWSDEQVWTAVSLDMQTDVVINQKGDDISMEDPDIIEEIIKGAMNWLEEVLPIIFEKVHNILERFLENIGEWIRKGIDYIIQAISKYL